MGAFAWRGDGRTITEFANENLSFLISSISTISSDFFSRHLTPLDSQYLSSLRRRKTLEFKNGSAVKLACVARYSEMLLLLLLYKYVCLHARVRV